MVELKGFKSMEAELEYLYRYTYLNMTILKRLYMV